MNNLTVFGEFNRMGRNQEPNKTNRGRSWNGIMKNRAGEQTIGRSRPREGCSEREGNWPESTRKITIFNICRSIISIYI